MLQVSPGTPGDERNESEVPGMARLLVPIPESQAMLGDVGRTTIWKLVKAKELEQVNIGRRSFITAESLEAYVGRLREAV